MENCAFKVVVAIFGSLSILFQAIGLFSPAWLLFDLKLNMEEVKLTENVELGLFAGRGCVETATYGEECAAFSMDKLSNTISSSDHIPEYSKSAASGLLGNFLPLQILTIFGCIATIGAVCIMFAQRRMAPADPTLKCLGASGAILWILSGILLIAAVGYEANQYATFKSSLDTLSKIPGVSAQIQISVRFPWAAVMTGLGALFCLLNGLIISVRMCFPDKQDSGMVGSWNKFTNQAI